MQSKYQQEGLTLIEIIVVLAIAAILAAVATPSLTTMVNNMGQSSIMTQLTNDLNRARIESVKRNVRVLACTRSTDAACGNITSWQNGWLVCYDENADGICDANTAANPNPIVIRRNINSNLTLVGSSAFIRFNPNGTQGTGVQETLTLGGTWAGATNKVVNIAGTGNISK